MNHAKKQEITTSLKLAIGSVSFLEPVLEYIQMKSHGYNISLMETENQSLCRRRRFSEHLPCWKQFKKVI